MCRGFIVDVAMGAVHDTLFSPFLIEVDLYSSLHLVQKRLQICKHYTYLSGLE